MQIGDIFHIADIKTPQGLVIEIQHSPISPKDIRAREDFYGQMIWIVDATESPIVLRGKFGTTQFVILAIRKAWSASRRSLFLDMGDDSVYRVIERLDETNVLAIAVSRPKFINAMFCDALKEPANLEPAASRRKLSLEIDLQYDNDGYFMFGGKVFRHKSLFKSLGMIWDDRGKVWFRSTKEPPLNTSNRVIEDTFSTRNSSQACYVDHVDKKEGGDTSLWCRARPDVSYIVDQRDVGICSVEKLAVCSSCQANMIAKDSSCRILFSDGDVIYISP